jgi:hypothetical protein
MNVRNQKIVHVTGYYVPSQRRSRSVEIVVEMRVMNSRIVAINGINLHVVELGNGLAVFLCQGFPEVWIEDFWRDQLIHFGQQTLKFLRDLPAAQGEFEARGEHPQ